MDITDLIDSIEHDVDSKREVLVYGRDHPLLFTEFKINVVMTIFMAFLLWAVMVNAV